MKFVTEFINKRLTTFLEANDNVDEKIIENINNEQKVKFNDLLKYINSILDYSLNNLKEDLNVLHIHFEEELDVKLKQLITEYLIIKYHKSYLEVQQNDSSLNDLTFEIESLHLKIKSFTYPAKKSREYPFGVSNSAYNEIIRQFEKNKRLLKYFKSINKRLKYKLIFNCNISISSAIKSQFETYPIATGLDENIPSTILINSDMSINDIDSIDNKIVESIDTVLMFDCERKSVMTVFSFEELEKWNTDYGTNFKNYLIFTFGSNSNSINNIRHKIESVSEKYKFSSNSTYTIRKSEIDFLAKRQILKPIYIHFIGLDESTFWSLFLLETNFRELYELRSIKLMNIYSLCFNDEIKEYILKDIFDEKIESEFISTSTKQNILSLPADEIDKIKDSLNGVLTLVLNSKIKSEIVNRIKYFTSIVLDDTILKSIKFSALFLKSLNISYIKLISWKEILSCTLENKLILSYRDQGRYPNYIYPNLLEIEFSKKFNVNAIFQGFLFKNLFEWASYTHLKETANTLKHNIRYDFFDWQPFQNQIKNKKPPKKINIDWDLENEYYNSENRDTYKIKFLNHKLKTFNGSDLFVITDLEKTNYKVVKAELLNSLEKDDYPFFIQSLDEIQETINIYEKIIENNQHEEELKVIRQQFEIDEEDVGGLWKILLKKKSEKVGELRLYEELSKFLTLKNLKNVSFSHFKQNWLNPKSDSIAPLSLKVFIELCNFLELPRIYFVIIQRIKNLSKQNNRHSTLMMNKLLNDLFNDGCFNNGCDVREIIKEQLNTYKLRHPFEELGIDAAYITENLFSLVDLIKSELRLLELEFIEKTEL